MISKVGKVIDVNRPSKVTKGIKVVKTIKVISSKKKLKVITRRFYV